MGAYTKEHFVAQSYLLHFICSDKKCCVYDKVTKKMFYASTYDICSKRNMYDLSFNGLDIEPPIGFDPKMNEKLLGIIDGFYPNILEFISSNDSRIDFSTNFSIRFEIYRFLAVQLFRTPKGKEILLSVLKGKYSTIPEQLENALFTKELINTISVEKPPIVMEFLIQEYGHICVGINISDKPLITSDLPIVGIGDSTSSYLFLPITPKKCLFFKPTIIIEKQDDIVLQEFLSGKIDISMVEIPKVAYERQKQLFREKNPLTTELSEKEVLLYNSYSYANCQRQIISSSEIIENETFIEIDFNSISNK